MEFDSPEISPSLHKCFDTILEEFAKERDRTAAASKREIVRSINNFAQRLRQAKTPQEVAGALLNALAPFCPEAAMFSVISGKLRHEGGLNDVIGEVEIAAAPAFASVAETKETVIAAGTPDQLSEPIYRLLGERQNGRVCLIPATIRQKVAGVLCAVPGDEMPDMSALELLTAIAAPHLLPEAAAAPAARLVRIDGGRSAPPPPRPAWQELSSGEREVHLRAQRFARTRIANLLLNRAASVRQGREARDLYGFLRTEIDTARSEFRKNFFEKSPSMVDYLHLEVLHTLAREDPDTLGPDYPGTLS